MGFSTSTKARAWVVTVNIENMKKAGLTETEYKNPEYLATVFSDIWRNSGKGRKCGVAVCESKEGLYHMHMALYGNLTTLGNVAKLMFNSHTEPQFGGKKALKSYMEKSDKHKAKDEKVLFTVTNRQYKEKSRRWSKVAIAAAIAIAVLTVAQIRQLSV